ncbi:MAG: DUF1727 domain-containing protein [Chloroflexi bacterium]|nr:MAG: DUF1727 domain-containing protein [Chloroflexota bacterium]
MRKSKSSQPTAQEASDASQERKMNRTPDKQPASKTSISQGQPRHSHPIRAGLAVVAGRTVGALSRRLHLGGGTSIVGIVAQRMYPEIVEHLATQLEHGSVIVTGTNGKTTTSSFIAAIMKDAGLSVWHNREGSNLMRGIASSLVIRAHPNGRLKRSGRAISILEVDEATLPQAVHAVVPRVAVFTNLFRDQLDRYGEVDSVTTRWQQAIAMLPPETTLILNADDPTTAQLGANFRGKVLYYGIDDLSLDLQTQEQTTQRHQVIDTRSCSNCGNDYLYQARFYSHMGHYTCTHCEQRRPQPDVRALTIHSDSFDRQRLTIATKENQQREVVLPLPGLYNIYNALAAVTAVTALNVDWEPITTGIEQSKPVFGRGERIQMEGRTVRLLLAKNPTGFNEVLRTLFANETPQHVLFVLNDNTADGRDVSWIWDVDFERAVGNTRTLVLAGTRARDLALRLKYAGIAQENMTIIPNAPLKIQKQAIMREERTAGAKKQRRLTAKVIESKLPDAYGVKKAILTAVAQTPVGETLFVVPTYTGLLEIHRELEQRGLTPHFWEGRDA